MKKYKVGNKIIDAKNPYQAVKLSKMTNMCDFSAMNKSNLEISVRDNFTFDYEKLKSLISNTISFPTIQKIQQIENVSNIFIKDLSVDVLEHTYNRQVGDELKRKYREVGNMLLKFAESMTNNEIAKQGYSELNIIRRNANELIENSNNIKITDSKLKDETYYVYLESPAGTELIGSGDYTKAQKIKAEKEKNWNKGDTWSVIVTNKQLKETNYWDSIKTKNSEIEVQDADLWNRLKPGDMIVYDGIRYQVAEKDYRFGGSSITVVKYPDGQAFHILYRKDIDESKLKLER